MANICVFCSAVDSIKEDYKKDAQELGKLISDKGHNLVYGGSQKGLMGVVALAVKNTSNGSKVIGILPEIFHHLIEIEDEAVKTKDLRDRKATMELRSDAFIALPGGYGTLDEIADVIVLKSLSVHSKPLVLLNTNGFFDKLIDYFKFLQSEGMAYNSNSDVDLFFVANSAEEAMEYLSRELS